MLAMGYGIYDKQGGEIIQQINGLFTLIIVIFHAVVISLCLILKRRLACRVFRGIQYPHYSGNKRDVYFYVNEADPALFNARLGFLAHFSPPVV